MEGKEILPDLLLYGSIGALPLWMMPLHAACQRVLTAIKPDFGVQAGALFTACVVNIIYVLVLVAWFWILPTPAAIDGVAGGLFVALAVNGMAFFYFQFVNMSLTSIHMSVLFRVFWAGELSKDRLLSEYNDRHMVSERLHRLAQLKQVELGDGLVHLRSRTMIFLAVPIYLWRRILGFRLPAK